MKGVLENSTKDIIMREYKEETWGKTVDGEQIKDGYKFRGKEPFKKAREGLEKLLVRGAKFEVENSKFQVLDTRDKGIEREVDIKMTGKNEQGVAVIKLYGPNKRKENVVTVTKSKQSDISFVTLMAEKAIKPLIKSFLGIKNVEIIEDVNKTNKCEYCEKSFKTIKGLKGHKTKKHMEDINKAQTINLENCEIEHLMTESEENEEDIENLDEAFDINEVKKYTSECSKCQQRYESSRKYGLIQQLLKHKEECGSPKTIKSQKKNVCQTCEFVAKDELILKRHKRDSHDLLSVSTSPPPKKTKLSQSESKYSQESMEIEESDHENMEVDTHETEEKILSRMMDEKVNAKAKRIEEEERNYQEKKRQEKESKEQKELLEVAMMKQLSKERKQKGKDQKKRNRKKYENDMKSTVNIPNIEQLPKNIVNLCKKGDKVYRVPGDGACGLNSVAAHLFKDEVFGPKLRRKINQFLVKHWNKKYMLKTQCSVETPFVRNIGSGGQISFTNHEKLFEYLENSEEADFMWTDSEDLVVVSDMYQVRIKIITTKGENYENPVVNWIYPDEQMKEFAELKDVEIDDIVLLHEKDVHFNLIISEDNDLSKVGSLSFMNNLGPIMNQEEQVLNQVKTKTYLDAVVKNIDEDKELKIEIKRLKNALQKSTEKITALEKQYDECEAVLKKVIEESEKLKSELKDLKQITKLEKSIEETSKVAPLVPQVKTAEITSPPLRNDSTKTTVDNDDVIIEEEFNCLECPFQGTELSQLNKHIQIKHRLQCRNCEETFKTKPDLMMHRKKEHYSAVALCKNGTECTFSEKCWWKHKKDNGNKIECFFCEESFATKGEVMIHRKKKHNQYVKHCNKFLVKNCDLNNETCWFKHEIMEEVSGNLENSDENKSVFWKLQNNLKSP